MEIKRYTVFTNIDENGKPHKPHISENKSGGWVKYDDVKQIIKNEQKRLELLNETKLKLKLSRNKGWAKSVTILVNIVHALETLEGVEVPDEG